MWFGLGCAVSVVSSLGVIGTFAWSKQRRRHPAALIASRSICDLCLAVSWLYQQQSGALDCSTGTGQAAALSTEFFVLASELLLACLAYDVLVHADDPFVDYKGNLVKYFALSGLVSAMFTMGMGFNMDSAVGESFLPICWTKFKGGRVISNANVPMATFFYIPWSLCLLLSCTALGRASVVLGLAKQKDVSSSRTSALRDSRRVLLFHASYWGLLLAFFGPLINHEAAEDELDEVLRNVVFFITGARAVENAAIWFGGSSSGGRGQRDLSPLLNLEMQREILAAAVRGMSQLLLQQTETEGEEEYTVKPVGGAIAPDPDGSNHERRYVAYSVLPMLLACASCGVIAIVDESEPSYVSVVFLALFCAISLVLVVSSVWGDKEAFRGHVVFKQLGDKQGFGQLRQEIWHTSALEIATALQACEPAQTSFSISAGKSGAFMFFAGPFVVKTISKRECDTLLNTILPKLVEHASHGPFLLAKVFAMFEMSFCYVNRRRVYLVVMENVVHGGLGSRGTRYDLKGSWVARTQAMPKPNALCICQVCHRAFEYGSRTRDRVCLLAVNQGPHRPKMLFKDNDFRERVLGRSTTTKQIRAQLSRDTLFLCELGLMDYSLLISVQRKLTMLNNDPEVLSPADQRLVVASLVEFPSAIRFGVVDWFTEYSLGKRLEFALKYYVCCMRERDARGFLGFSSVEPAQYRNRFLARVVDVVFPVLTNVVQLVVQSTGETVALDVTGVHSFPELNRLVTAAISQNYVQLQ
ncbi:hypothetical protein BASA81_002618 [Batrachochytrium salamandrivorans]|nr:hypothetical protein BASA81_002618 [Batrachochytrium salamandrivorans]